MEGLNRIFRKTELGLDLFDRGGKKGAMTKSEWRERVKVDN